MPLPPAPTKRAALLSPDAFRATAKSRMEDPQTEESLDVTSPAALPAGSASAPRKAARKAAPGTTASAGRARTAAAPA
ncbi:phosphate starvation-inducible protein PhoH, partial [Paracidovorax avenae]